MARNKRPNKKEREEINAILEKLSDYIQDHVYELDCEIIISWNRVRNLLSTYNITCENDELYSQYMEKINEGNVSHLIDEVRV